MLIDYWILMICFAVLSGDCEKLCSSKSIEMADCWSVFRTSRLYSRGRLCKISGAVGSSILCVIEVVKLGSGCNVTSPCPSSTTCTSSTSPASFYIRNVIGISAPCSWELAAWFSSWVQISMKNSSWLFCFIYSSCCRSCLFYLTKSYTCFFNI